MYDRKPELYEYEPEMTFREIAKVLNTSRNTVYNDYVSAMKKVTRYFKRRKYNETI